MIPRPGSHPLRGLRYPFRTTRITAMPAAPYSIENVRVLLIQARNTRGIERQEQECFLERCRLRREQLATINVVREPVAPEALDGFDALMIGGAGEYSALDTPAWMPPLLETLRAAVRRHLPTFGSCWGHQLLARAFGGRVVHDPDRAELGSGEVELTAAGRTDPLFSRFPRRFTVNMGHHDRVAELPPNAVELAFNASQRNQAFRLAGRPVYGTQFHSELDAARERERLVAYRSYYKADLPTEAEFQRVLDDLKEVTEVDDLLYDFLMTFVVRPAGADQPAAERRRS